MSNLEEVIQYANDCIKGVTPSCIFVQQACRRFLDDLDNDLYYFDEDQVDTLVAFCESFNLTEQTTITKTKLVTFQKFIIANCWGLYKKENLKRKYRTAYIEVGRGNAKTQLIVMLALFELLTGTDSQIILAADTTKMVVEVDFDKARKLCRQIDPSGKEIRCYYNKIVYGSNKLIVTSNEAKQLEGLSGSYLVIDEMHLMKDLSVYNALKTSLAKRSDNLLFVITTAGNDINSECYRMRNYCTKVLSGEFDDPSQFAMVFTIDENDDYTDPKVWSKSNPLLGIAIDRDAIGNAVNQARQNDQEKASVLSRHFCVWTKKNADTTFLQDSHIRRAVQEDLNINDMDLPVFVGADLSVNDDLTAVSYMIERDGVYYFFNDYYVPELALTTKRNRLRYEEAAKQGYINVIPGDAIDYDFIISHIQNRSKSHDIRLIGYDRYKAGDFIKKLTNDFNLVAVSQLASGMNKPIQELQRAFLLDKVKIQYNPLTVWMLSNVILKTTYTGLVTLDRTSEHEKIDGVAAMCDALAAYLNAPDYGLSIW